MKNLLNIVGAGALMLLFACGSGAQEEESDGKVIISGELENSPEGLVLLSEYMDDRTEVIDTIEVNAQGEFEHGLELDKPGFYEVNLYDEKILRLALFKEDVRIFYDFQVVECLSMEGSWDTDQMVKVDELAIVYQEEINKLNSAYYEAMSAKDQEAIKGIQEDAMQLESRHADRVKETIKSMDGSFSALAAVGMLNPRNDFQFLDSLMTELDSKYPNT